MAQPPLEVLSGGVRCVDYLAAVETALFRSSTHNQLSHTILTLGGSTYLTSAEELITAYYKSGLSELALPRSLDSYRPEQKPLAFEIMHSQATFWAFRCRRQKPALSWTLTSCDSAFLVTRCQLIAGKSGAKKAGIY